MSPEELKDLLIDLHSAAEIVEAIHDPELQRRRGWDLRQWDYRCIPWGVCFYRQGGENARGAEIQTALSWHESQQLSPYAGPGSASILQMS